jgi:hypothetical protein
MTAIRRHRLITAFLAVVSLVFMQLAVAGYICPTGGMSGVGGSAMASHVGMPCAASMAKTMDQSQPGLCHAHCQADPQSADTYQLPNLPILAAIAADFPLMVVIAADAHVAPLQAPLLQRATAPPLSVQNCCFRM